MRINMIAPCLILLCAGVSSAQENPVDIDFNRALKLAISNNTGLNAAGDAVKVEENRVRESISAFYPNVDAYSSYTVTSLVSEIEIANPLTGSIETVELFPENRYNFGLQLAQDIYTFGRRSARVTASRKGLERSRLSHRQFRQQLYDATARAFASLLIARDNLSIQSANIERTDRKIAIVESRIDQGVASEYDRIRARMLKSKYRDRLNLARGEFSAARTRLVALMHWDRPYEFMAVGEIAEMEATLPESAEFQAEENLAMRKLKLGHEILTQERSINRSAYFPRIGFLARYEWQNGYQPDIDKIRGYWSAGIALNWRIIDGGYRKSRLRRSTFEVSKMRNMIADRRRELESGFELAVTGIETSSEELSLARERLRLADDGLAIAESRYQQGLLGISDLIDLELDKADAELSVAVARYNLLLARLDLKRAMDYYPELDGFDN
jgi:outer membrane protein TolC